MAGRKLKLTPELIKNISSAIIAGNYAKIACELVGIGETTYYKWLEMAEEENAPAIYREFRESIKRAEATAEITFVTRVRQAADNGTWQAAAWYLERKHGERWGRNDKIRQEISGPNGTPISLTVEEAKAAVLSFLEEGNHGAINSGTDTDITEEPATEVG